MKIAIITHNFVYNDGQGIVNTELAKYLAKKGHNLFLIGCKFDESLKKYENIRLIKIIVLFEKPNILKQIIFSVISDFVLFFLKPDLIHLNGANTFLHKHHINHVHFCHSYWVKELKKINEHKIKKIYHYFYHSFNAFWEKLCFRYLAKIIVAVSPKVKYEIKNYCNIPGEKISVIPNGVDINKFTPEKKDISRKMLIEKFGLKRDDFILLFAGDMRTDRKGFGTLIKAMELLKDYNDIKLIAMGSLEGNIFIDKVIEKKLKNIYFAGFVKDTENYFPGVDLFLTPSYQCDHYSLVIFESLSSGTPVITSPFYFVKKDEYLIRDEYNGFSMKSPNDYSGIKNYVLKLYKDKKLLKKLAENARKTALNLSFEKTGENFENLYKKLSYQ